MCLHKTPGSSRQFTQFLQEGSAAVEGKARSDGVVLWSHLANEFLHVGGRVLTDAAESVWTSLGHQRIAENPVAALHLPSHAQGRRMGTGVSHAQGGAGTQGIPKKCFGMGSREQWVGKVHFLGPDMFPEPLHQIGLEAAPNVMLNPVDVYVYHSGNQQSIELDQLAFRKILEAFDWSHRRNLSVVHQQSPIGEKGPLTGIFRIHYTGSKNDWLVIHDRS